MQAEDKNILDRTIGKEGFDYAMTQYSKYNGSVEFNHIHDKKFHELLKNMMEARKELAAYCGEHSSAEITL